MIFKAKVQVGQRENKTIIIYDIKIQEEKATTTIISRYYTLSI